MLEIHLLGSVQVLDEEKLLPPFPTQRSRELFASLAARPNHPHPRATLAGSLWPEKTEDKARASLNTELWRVRQVLGAADKNLELTREAVALNIPVDQVDIHKFRALAKRGDVESLQQAVELYRGEFLEGCYADWCLLEREQLFDLLRGALEGLLRHHEARGELSEAISIAKRLNAYDPLREEIHRALMRLYTALGDCPAALAQYQSCKAILKRELDVAPMPETEALFQRISRQSEGQSDFGSPVRPEKIFVGRARALQWLDKIWSQVTQGNTRAAIVTGESGIGKTRLIERWLSGMEGQAVILRGRCYDVYQQAALHPIREMLQSAARGFGASALEELPNALLAELGKLAPELKDQLPRVVVLASLPPAQARERLMEALSCGLRAYAERERPLILFFDDLQWADNESLDLIAGLLRKDERHPILLIASYRSDALALAASSRMDARVEKLGADSFFLESLSRPETMDLIRNLGKLSDAPGRFGEQVHAETEGNPLFVIETLRGLFDAGYLAEGADGAWAIPLDRQRAEAVRLPLPASLREVIRKRVERLTANQKRLLAVAAILGREFHLETLLAISGMEASACGDALRLLLRNGLIEETQGGYAFSHVRVQEFLLDELNESERRELHRQTARFLESKADRPLERLAHHYRQAGEAERALEFLEQAGERDMRLHAHKTAAAHFESALPLCEREQDAPVRLRILMNLYQCNWATAADHLQMGKILDEAQRVAETGGESEQIVSTRYYRALNMISRGQWEEARPLMEDALERAIASRHLEFEMRARQELSNLMQYMGRSGEAKEHTRKSLALARKLKDVRAEGRVRWDLASFELDAQGQAKIALQIMERAFKTNTPALLIEIGSSIVSVMLRAGNPGAALAQAERLLAFGREQGIHTFVKTVQRAQARVLCEIGRYETALQLAKESLAASRLTGYRYGEMRALTCMGMGNAGLGYFEDALRDLASAAKMCEQMNSKMDLDFARAEIASILLRRGDAAHFPIAESIALQILVGGFEDDLRSWHVTALACLARIRLANGQLEEARQHSARAVTLMESDQNRDFSPDPRVYFAHFAALRTLDDEAARDFLQRARVTLYCRARTLPSRLRRDYLRRVPAHREICAARWR